MTDPDRPHRGTIFVEDAEVIGVSTFPDEQYVIRLHAPKCAASATAGSFIHLQCDTSIPMRRPLSIMRADPVEGWLDILFKVVGEGLGALARKAPGDRLSSMGPIGHGFAPSPVRPRTLLIGGGVGIPPMVFLAETLKDEPDRWQPTVLMGSEIPFPFEVGDSAIDAAWAGSGATAGMALLESWGVLSRLASLADIPGTFRGYVTALGDRYLASLDDAERGQCEIFACGPTPMLEATAALAARWDLPCQVSLEEYMACAVGGCAGCTVLVQTETGPAMRRVCVDGPVFEAASVFPQA